MSMLSGLIPRTGRQGRNSPEASRAVERLMRPSDTIRELDPVVLWAAIGLLMLGLVMVYSSSIAIAEGSRFTRNQQHFFLMRHAVFVGIGVAAGLLAFRGTISNSTTGLATLIFAIVLGCCLLLLYLLKQRYKM